MILAGRWVRARSTGSVLLFVYFTRKTNRPSGIDPAGVARNSEMGLLLFEVDGLVRVVGDALADLGGGLAKLRLLVGVEAFLGAGRALGAVQRLETAAEAGMAQGFVAAAVAGKLVGDAGDPGHLLVDVRLPRVAGVVASELAAGQDRRERAHFERGRGVVGRHVVRRVGELGIADDCEDGDGDTEKPAAGEQGFHVRLSGSHCRRMGNGSVSGCGRPASKANCRIEQKKTARTFCCSCREASDANYSRRRGRRLPLSSPEYLHDTIDSQKSKYKNRNSFLKSFWNRLQGAASNGRIGRPDGFLAEFHDERAFGFSCFQRKW